MGRRITLAVVLLLTAGCGGTTDSGTGGGFSGGGATGSGGTPGTGGSRSGGATGNGGAFAGGAPGSGGQGGMGGAGACTPPCGLERQCCVDHCVNLQNDPLNCGYCGHQCSGGTYCTGGACMPPDCQTVCSSGTCCGTACCTGGDLCCDPQGPLSMGPVCTTPVNGTCPMGCAPLCVCASPDTPIATPGGERPIAALRVGDLVYSIHHGAMTAVPVVRVNRTPVSGHHVMRVTLRTGAVLEISPGHPMADGHHFATLRPGDALDGVVIDGATLVPYAHDATYDILPDSDTGTYFAGGVLIGSTLARDAVSVDSPTAPLSR